MPRTREQAYHARNRTFSLARGIHAEMLVRLSSHVIRHGYKTGMKYVLVIYAFSSSKNPTKIMQYPSLMLSNGSRQLPLAYKSAKIVKSSRQVLPSTSPSPSASPGIRPAYFSLSSLTFFFLCLSPPHNLSPHPAPACPPHKPTAEPITSSQPTSQTPPAHTEKIQSTYHIENKQAIPLSTILQTRA